MNVLLDIHHHDLFRSLYILFKKRFGFNVYIPTGLDWNTYFNYAPYPQIDTVKQYLVGIESWINIGNDVPDVKFLTLDEYKDIKIDISVASLLENNLVFFELNKKFDKKTKHITQVGNNFPVNLIDHIGKNLLSSSSVVYELSNIKHKIFYHQEFDLECFYPEIPKNAQTIYSFQHYFGSGCQPFTEDYRLFNQLKNEMMTYSFKCYGQSGDGGNITNIPDQFSKIMRNCGFVFHTKPTGDGYGHIYHNAYACGKPVIYKSKYLKYNQFNMTPMMLFSEETSIDLSKLTINQCIHKIIEMTNSYSYTSEKVSNRFKEVVNFENEFQNINKFITNLV